MSEPLTVQQRIPDRIVAEVNRTWPHSETPLLSQQFEQIIKVNKGRGYALESWRMTSTLVNSPETEPGLNETIIAVFVKIDP